MEKITYGIDIGGTTVKVGVFSAAGELLDKMEIPTDLSCGGKNILPDIADLINEDMTKRSLSTKDIAGAGIGVPGPVLDHRIVNRCVNLGWGVTDVAAAFRELTGIERIPVLNDANAAALGEYCALRNAPGTTPPAKSPRDKAPRDTVPPNIPAAPEDPAAVNTLTGVAVPAVPDRAAAPAESAELTPERTPADPAAPDRPAGTTKPEHPADPAARTPRTMALITIGTGIGCGIIQDGQILPGAFGAAGEIGHMHMPPGTTLQPDKAAGMTAHKNTTAAIAAEVEPAQTTSAGEVEPENAAAGSDYELEKLAAAGGIVKRMTALAESGRYPTSLDPSKPLTPKDIAAAAAAGDICAVKTLEETGVILGIALSYVACVIDPGLFVIGGGIARAGSLLLEPIKKSFARHCFHASSDTSFRLAKLGNDAGIFGAARAVLSTAIPG